MFVFKGTLPQCISRQICVLVERFILGFWLNDMTNIFSVFSYLVRNGFSFTKTSFRSIHHVFNQKTKITSPKDSPRDALGRWPFRIRNILPYNPGLNKINPQLYLGSEVVKFLCLNLSGRLTLFNIPLMMWKLELHFFSMFRHEHSNTQIAFWI